MTDEQTSEYFAKVHPHNVIDRRTGAIVGTYKGRRRASRKVNKLDLEYGACRYHYEKVAEEENNMITNLSQFKNALTLGSMWETTHYNHAGNKSSLGIRSVSIKQSNGVAFKTEDNKHSWMYFEKASNYEFRDNAIFVYWPESDDPHFRTERRLVLEYKQVA